MSDVVRLQIQGADSLIEFFRDLPKALTDAVIKETARKGANEIAKEARKNFPLTGALGRVSRKKAARVVGVGKTAVRVTVGNNDYVDLNGKQVSVAKIIRHLTAGPQQSRYRRGRNGRKISTGRVNSRYGDYIVKSFAVGGPKATDVMKRELTNILQRRINRYAR